MILAVIENRNTVDTHVSHFPSSVPRNCGRQMCTKLMSCIKNVYARLLFLPLARRTRNAKKLFDLDEKHVSLGTDFADVVRGLGGLGSGSGRASLCSGLVMTGLGFGQSETGV